MVKSAGLVLLDEPLANLDYKLREELRAELPRIFAETGAIFVYATTEPHEALLLGGIDRDAVGGPCDPVRADHRGLSADPVDLATARIFSDPPLNTIVLRKQGGGFSLEGGLELPAPEHLSGIAEGPYTIGFQPHHLSLTRPTADAVGVRAKVTVDRDHRLGKLRPSRFRRRPLGDVCARHSPFRGRRGSRGVHRSAPSDGVRRRRPKPPADPAEGRLMARIDLDAYPPFLPARSRRASGLCAEGGRYQFADGGAYALLGPSGCGKTTLLNIISGLLTASEGRLLFDGIDVNDLPTQERNIAQVFQFPVIYDTMTVYDNLAFPLRNRRVPEADVDRRCARSST